MAAIVKICGITCVEDALIAADAGADAVGLMFYDGSPRHVSVGRAGEIHRALPPHISRVGVFVNADAAEVTQAIAACGLSILQFHGEETPEFCRQFPLMTVKAFRVSDAQSLSPLQKYATDAWLLDAHIPDARGGTGTRFNWDLAVEAQKLGRPILLAGGLTPENVGEAIARVQPFGVDVSSGVELAPGRKCPEKVRAFVAAARSA